MRAYFDRLCDAFGWRYVAAVMLTYGVNQGAGERLVYTAAPYLIMDAMHLPSKDAGRLMSIAAIPWQLKSLFGLASDAIPICGFHRQPYMVIAGLMGTVACALLTVLPFDTLSFTLGTR